MRVMLRRFPIKPPAISFGAVPQTAKILPTPQRSRANHRRSPGSTSAVRMSGTTVFLTGGMSSRCSSNVHSKLPTLQTFQQNAESYGQQSRNLGLRGAVQRRTVLTSHGREPWLESNRGAHNTVGQSNFQDPEAIHIENYQCARSTPVTVT